MAHDTDVLIIGAGPIGLIKAWGLKKLNPHLKVVILEKYSEYQRNHILNMQPQHLEALMRATHTEQDPKLQELLTRLKQDNHILTTDLQQFFTKLATDCGVEIKTSHNVTVDEFPSLISDHYPNVKLIVGADGTHSVTSQALFSPENQVKYEFDYVLQMRYEIQGLEKAPRVENLFFYQQILRKGLVANEYVGQHVDGKTPVTLQMMISREDYLHLKTATSKNPLRPFDHSSTSTLTLPDKLQSFIGYYLHNRIEQTAKKYFIDKENIRISVNETPATHAKKIITSHQMARVILVGDAALGLSYFKGLNAGLEASAKFFTFLEPAIQEGFQNQGHFDILLATYQTWLLREFAPRKIKEVANYSFWQIRSLLHVTQTVSQLFNASSIELDEYFAADIDDYFEQYSQNALKRNLGEAWNPYPHRSYPPAQFTQLTYVSLSHTGKKILKLFADYSKPYKSKHHMIQDFKQPLVGLGNLAVGLGKMVVGLYTQQGYLCLDGICTVVRGLIELVTTPLAWIIKPIFRQIATFLHGGYKDIEENTHLQAIAQHGQDYLSQTNDSALVESTNIVYLLAVCNDLHRKFLKQHARGQATKIELEECTLFASIRSSHELDRQSLSSYFSLFASNKSNSSQNSSIETNSQRERKETSPLL